MTPTYWDEAKGHLARSDRRLAKIISSYNGESLKKRGDAFYTLARSIVGQQISVKAADTIWQRFAAETKANPQSVIAAKEDALKNCGLSSQKVAYLKSISEFCIKIDSRVKHENDTSSPSSSGLTRGSSYFDKLSDEEIIRQLCEIKGVGRWTAEMFMIFYLQRPDILPLADLGLQKAIEKAYGEDADPKIISEKWRPFRSVATWYLWRSLDPVPVEY